MRSAKASNKGGGLICTENNRNVQYDNLQVIFMQQFCIRFWFPPQKCIIDTGTRNQHPVETGCSCRSLAAHCPLINYVKHLNGK